jgi:hypothetical protein
MANLESHIKLQTKCKIKYSERNEFFCLDNIKETPGVASTPRGQE